MGKMGKMGLLFVFELIIIIFIHSTKVFEPKNDLSLKLGWNGTKLDQGESNLPFRLGFILF